MLPSKLRISKEEFKLFGRGISYHSPYVFLTVYKKPIQTPSQFSFICSKKISKSAVKRNLLRRRGYNVIQKLLNDVKPGFYLVFNFKKGAERLTYVDIKEIIQSLLNKTELFV